MTNDSKRGQTENYQSQIHLDVRPNHGFANPSFLSLDEKHSENQHVKKAERAMSPTLSVASLSSAISNKNLRKASFISCNGKSVLVTKSV